MPGLTPARSGGSAGGASPRCAEAPGSAARAARHVTGHRLPSQASPGPGCKSTKCASSADASTCSRATHLKHAPPRRLLRCGTEPRGDPLQGSGQLPLPLAGTLGAIAPWCSAQQAPASPGHWPRSPLSKSIHCSIPLRSGEVASWDRMGPRARMLGAMKGDSSGMASAARSRGAGKVRAELLAGQLPQEAPQNPRSWCVCVVWKDQGWHVQGLRRTRAHAGWPVVAQPCKQTWHVGRPEDSRHQATTPR